MLTLLVKLNLIIKLDQIKIYMYIPNLAFGIVAAYFISMFSEVPMIALEKIVFKRS
jgi:hypothetical protein